MRTRYIKHPLEPGIGLFDHVARMPTILSGLIFSLLASNAVTFGLAGSAFAISAISAGVALIGSLLLNRLLGKSAAPSPSDVQANIRQEVGARRRIYGRVLTGSIVVFGFRRGQKTYVLHYIGEGPIEGYVSYRLDKKPVTLDEDGFVTEDQYQNGGRSRVQILTTLGLMTDEPFQAILDAFPELDDEMKPFRHRGCAMLLQICEQVPYKNIQDVYPNNLPSMQVVVDGLNNIYDPRTETSGLTGNAGLCLLAEAMDVYGLTPADEDEIDFDAWSAFADHCDEDVDLKAGGTEKRYRCAGVITMDGENEARIAAISAICNADVYIDAQGRLSVRKRLQLEPTIALREKNGDHLSVQLEGGRGEQKKFNRVDVTYVDPALNYKSNVVSWRNADLIEEDGRELPQPLSIPLCPSATQAMRIGKLYLHEANPEYVGSLMSGPQALELLEEASFLLDLSPENDIERIAVNTSGIEFDSDSATCSASFVIPYEGATDWDEDEDEQEQVEIPPELPTYVDDVPIDVLVTVELLEGTVPVLKFSWEAAEGYELPDSYSQQIEVSVADLDEWSPANVNQEQLTAQYAPVADGGAYDWRIRSVGIGKSFDWQYSDEPVTVVIDTVAPAALTGFSADNGTGQFTANFSSTADVHLASVAIYKVPTGDPLDRETHIVAPRFGVAPAVAYALPISSAAGTFDIYAEPFNRSSVAGPLSGPDTVTVT